MKVLICTNHSYMFWQFRRELTQALLKKGEVVLSTPFVGHEEELAALGCRMVETGIDRRGLNPVTDLKLFCFYWKLLKRENPRMVITYSIKPNIYCGLACRMQKIPYCVNVQGLGTAFQRPVLAAAAKFLYKIALQDAKTTFFENEGNARKFRDLGIQTAARQTVLHGAGVNLAHYDYRCYPENDRVHFLYLGRIMKEKGIDELFAAARRLRAEGCDFVLDLVGFYEDAYKDQVAQLEKEGIAVFHGFQPDPRPWYAGCDCVVLPSYHEGMSNVLLEGAATGRPLITSDIPGCREAVVADETGLLCPAGDADGVYNRMKQILTMGREARAAMGRRGRQHIKTHFEKSAVVRCTLEAIEK